MFLNQITSKKSV